MTQIGAFLSSEEHGSVALLEQAQLASDVGIEAVWISDHFHPWLYINQIGVNQREFFEFFASELAPALADIGATTRAESGRLAMSR